MMWLSLEGVWWALHWLVLSVRIPQKIDCFPVLDRAPSLFPDTRLGQPSSPATFTALLRCVNAEQTGLLQGGVR